MPVGFVKEDFEHCMRLLKINLLELVKRIKNLSVVDKGIEFTKNKCVCTLIEEGNDSYYLVSHAERLFDTKKWKDAEPLVGFWKLFDVRCNYYMQKKMKKSFSQMLDELLIEAVRTRNWNVIKNIQTIKLLNPLLKNCFVEVRVNEKITVKTES